VTEIKCFNLNSLTYIHIFSFQAWFAIWRGDRTMILCIYF
jgi:hypothetical protein